MCLVSSPSAKPVANTTPEYLHNPYLDSGTMTYATGRNQLKVDLNTSGQAGLNLPTSPPGFTPTPSQPRTGIAGLNIAAPSPGTVVPTIGGAMSGSLPGAVAGGRK